jgi:hypothetical protein
MSSKPRETYTEFGASALMMAVTVSGLSLAVTDVDTPAASSVDPELILCDLCRREALEACLCWLLAAAAVAKSGEATLLHCTESTMGCLRWIMAGRPGLLID